MKRKKYSLFLNQQTTEHLMLWSFELFELLNETSAVLARGEHCIYKLSQEYNLPSELIIEQQVIFGQFTKAFR